MHATLLFYSAKLLTILLLNGSVWHINGLTKQSGQASYFLFFNNFVISFGIYAISWQCYLICSNVAAMKMAQYLGNTPQYKCFVNRRKAPR